MAACTANVQASSRPRLRAGSCIVLASFSCLEGSLQQRVFMQQVAGVCRHAEVPELRRVPPATRRKTCHMKWFPRHLAGASWAHTSAMHLRLVAAVASGLAVQALVVMKAFGRSGFGRQSYDQQEAQRAEKRNREASQFFTYQRRLIRTGCPPRDDKYWKREEQMLFHLERVTAGINFNDYEEVPVARRGGRGIEKPVDSFQDIIEEFEIPQELAGNIQRCQYSTPTPVQKHSTPAALSGTDVMVAAQTGSGKTAAFLVPIIAAALRAGVAPLEEGPVSPTSVILSPTRELCQQIAVEARKLCFRTELRVVAIYGGADAIPQLKQMAEGCEIAICTPGRLTDFLDRGVVTMDRVQKLVLDEADRMLDMGFEPQIRQIVDGHGMPRSGPEETARQTMMFSATFPKEIQELALDFLDPTYLWVGVGLVGNAVTSVDQRFTDASTVDDMGKMTMLIENLGKVESPSGGRAKTIVFANSKSVVDDLTWTLSDNRIRASQIHGGLSQAARDRALNDLRTGRVAVLIATDVAARGLDLPGIDHVINYELPKCAEDYVHRIGRTGRIGNKGVATSFVSSFEPALKDIVERLEAQSKEDLDTKIPRWLQQQAYRHGGMPSLNRYSQNSNQRGNSYDRYRSGSGEGRDYGGGRFGNGRQGKGGGRGGYRGGRGEYGGGRGDYGGGRDDYGGRDRNGGTRERTPRRGPKDSDKPPWARGLPPRRRY